MSNPAVVQVQSSFYSGSFASNVANFSAVLDNFVMGHAVCVVVTTMNGTQPYQVTDNDGNIYTLVPNTEAAVASGPSISVWVCLSANVNLSTLVLSVLAQFNVGVSNASVCAYEISGIGSGGVSASTSVAFPTGAVTALILSGGSGALYITGISGISDSGASIPSPWSVDSDTNDASFAIVSSGTASESALWTPANQSNNNPHVVAGVAFNSTLSNGGGGGGEPETRNDCDRGGVCNDGLTVQFIANCDHGLVGETKKLSTSSALALVTAGKATLVY